MAFYAHWSEKTRGYAVAIVATGVALLVRLAMLRLLGDRAPFFPFVLAVLVAAWYGGLKPGLLATGLGAVLGDYFFVEPFRSSGSINLGGPMITAAFLVVCVTASLACEALHVARRRIEEQQRELQRVEERIRSVVDHVVDGIITIDERGTVESFNPAAEKLFGYTSSEVIGQNIKLLMPKPYSDDHDTYLSNFCRTGQARIIGIGREVIGLRKDGTTFPMDLAVSECRIDRGRFFTGIVRDISERKAAELALKEADRRKDEFLAILAHELRNPLAPLSNALQIMPYVQSDAKQLTDLRCLMERQVRQLVRLVDDLMDVNRITKGKLNLQMGPVNLTEVMQSSVECVRPLIDEMGHELIVSLPSDSIRLEGDAVRLGQVVSNLLNNAAKYTERGGHIWLTAQQEADQLVVSVRDTGIGIAAEDQKHIFRTFSQVTSALDRSQGGLGIGLSLVSGLVELHGGSVEAHSGGVGLGSEFIVRLPLLQESCRRADDGFLRGPHTGGGAKCRIIVVDDNRDAADSLAIMLERRGYEIHMAHDGLEAVQAAATFRPWAVLLDIGLPTLNGYEVARQIRGQPWGREMALIALTGWGQEEDKRKASEAGFDHHLTKPADWAVLNTILDQLSPVSSANGKSATEPSLPLV